MQYESVAFYLRILFLPLILIISPLRAWVSTWSGLEAAHQRQEYRFRRMWDLLPDAVREAAEAEETGKIQEPAVRRFATMLAEYKAMGPRFEGARRLNSKFHYRNILDSANRRLRVAEALGAQALEELGRSPEG